MSSEILEKGSMNIHSLIVSPSLSVISVFFDVVFNDLILKPNFELEKERLEKIRRKLVHATPFLRGKLTQMAGLKYAPELRFFPYKFGGSPTQILVWLM